MSKLVVEAIVILALPTVALVGGGWLIMEISGRERVTQLLAKAEPADQKPLGRRLTYDIDAVRRHWDALDDDARHSEQSFLKLDLVFPLLYGGALAFSLIMAWAALGQHFNPAWVLAPVLITVLADWTENLVQLNQLNRYITGGAIALQTGWIRIASIATMLKLSFSIGASLILLSLVLVMLVRAFKHS